MATCSTDAPSSTNNTAASEQRASRLDNLSINPPSSNTITYEQESSQIDQENKSFFVCKYCGKCTLEQFFLKQGCFSSHQQESLEKKITLQHTPTEKKILFPYLDMSGLDEADRVDLEDQLETETREIILTFARFLSHVRESLEDLVSLDIFKLSVLSLQAFTNGLAVKILDEEDQQKIEKAKTLSEVFIILVRYIFLFLTIT